MSSTEATDVPLPDDDSPAARLARFHDEVLAPLAAADRSRGFPLKPDARCASYWVARPRPAMQRSDFEAPSCLDEDELARAFAAHWQSNGQPQLAALAPRIAALAGVARAKPADHGEVSPFIYTMF